MGPGQQALGVVKTDPACPFCDSPRTQKIAAFGSQIITGQWSCLNCGSYFDAVREEFDDEPADAEAPASSRRK